MRFGTLRTWQVFLAVTLLSLALAPGGAKPRHSRRAVSASEAQAAAARKQKLRQKLSGVRSHMHQVRAKIHQVKQRENQITESIDVVEARISATRARLSRANSRLKHLERERRATERSIAETQERLAVRRRLLGARLAANYERGQTTYTQVLLRSRTLHELLSRGYYVRQIVKSDADLIQGVKEDLHQLAEDKVKLERQEAQQKALAEEFEADKNRYTADLGEKQQILEGVREVRELAEDELDGLEEEANAMNDNIRELSELLEQRRQAERAAHAANGQQHPGHRRRGDRTPSDEGDSAPIWHGGFIRPVSARITSGFGSRYHPILHRVRMHTGVDYGAGYGSPIHAAGGGTVILAHYSHGYGNCVVIDHGNGITTLYGHCSELLVSVNEVVRQGQVIARVGATGLATGPHLHFEVRHNGVPVNPL